MSDSRLTLFSLLAMLVASSAAAQGCGTATPIPVHATVGTPVPINYTPITGTPVAMALPANCSSGSSCGGTVVGGFCWYASAAGDSCTNTCSSHGGYNAATRTYAGSDGTDANCQAVASAIGGYFMDGSTMSTDPVGCAGDPNTFTALRVTSPATTAAATGIDDLGDPLVRFCSCNN